MDTVIDIKFNVTPQENETIHSRALENGFDEASTYIKVVALKTESISMSSADASSEEASVEIGFQVTETQKLKIEEQMKENGCKDLTTYLKHLALYGVVSATVEVRSSGNFADMVKRIAERKAKSKLI